MVCSWRNLALRGKWFVPGETLRRKWFVPGETLRGEMVCSWRKTYFVCVFISLSIWSRQCRKDMSKSRVFISGIGDSFQNLKCVVNITASFLGGMFFYYTFKEYWYHGKELVPHLDHWSSHHDMCSQLLVFIVCVLNSTAMGCCKNVLT